MFMQIFSGTIGKLTFNTAEKMDTEQAKKYALQKLQNGNYKSCTIGEIYVNGELVLENVKISE